MELHDEMPSEKYYRAHICNDGHEQRDNDNKHCPDCGSEVINSCQSCGTIIKRGTYEGKARFLNPDDGYDFSGYEHYQIPFENFEIPSYCHECGKPYLWTEKKLSEYKLILELQSDEIDQTMQDSIYKATEDAIKQKFKGNSVMILGLMFNKLSAASKVVMINALSSVASTEVIKLLTGQ